MYRITPVTRFLRVSQARPALGGEECWNRIDSIVISRATVRSGEIINAKCNPEASSMLQLLRWL